MESNQQLANRSLAVEQDDDEIDLLKLWQTIWNRKWSIITLTLVVAMVAVLVVLSLTPIYRAAATLLIEQKQAKVVSIEQVYGLDGSGNEYLQTQFELLKSRSLAERVVRELGLTTHPEFDPRQQEAPLFDVKGWLGNLNLNSLVPGVFPEDLEEELPPTEDEIFDKVVVAFMKRISVEPQGKSQLVRVQVDMADPRMAAQAANRLAQGFIESQLEASMEMSASASSWMNSRLGELRSKLKEAETQLQAFREKENLVDIGGVATISAAELAATSDRMVDARRSRAEAESLYRQVQSMKSGGWRKLATVSAVLGDPLIQQFKVDEARAKAKIDELSKRYGARHPTMEAARTELAAAEASLRGQVEQVVAGIERNYRLAVANEQSLRSSVNENKAQIQHISRKEFQLSELQREVDTNRALYDTFLTRIKETTATSDLDTANARVVDKAVVPKVPVKPKKALIVLLATFLAGLVGVGLSLLLEMLNNTFKSVDDVEQKLNLPVLGLLPLIKKHDRKQLAHLFAADTNHSFSESVRSIRTSVVLAGLERAQKVLLVTSTVPGEGNSTVSASIATALAQVEKVVLIDADMRRPTLAKNFDFAVGTPGLANVIAGTAELDQAIQQINGVDMISAGTVPPNPLELLSSERFAELIQQLAATYDRVVIDSPPTQAVSDALVVGSLADALIYVVKHDDTAVPLVQKGVGQLLQHKVPVTGVVLNQVDVKKAKKQGYSYGGYYDYYGYSKGSKQS
ncbi:GumC family protein [Thiopseudomonas alkaliphila]|uniref:GumC family protein n=1 Tax=Thiopseudomonas alkaliphila TaxID=1697053 RepID=UPI00069E30FE|nr:polysaccharide biosynthesis tyrosine autokinase [Thiopseudomonas alkaliphila]AKX52918.1 lipopolysaccharide biosynthesis protein [Thiopseudomonas alkaliphila]